MLVDVEKGVRGKGERGKRYEKPPWNPGRNLTRSLSSSGIESMNAEGDLNSDANKDDGTFRCGYGHADAILDDRQTVFMCNM